MNPTETVYLGHNNVIIRYLRDDREPAKLTDVTRVELRDTGCIALIDSDISPSAFDWSEGGGKLSMHLGQEPVLPGTYSYHLIVYDPSHPDGLVWDKIKIRFSALCPVT